MVGWVLVTEDRRGPVTVPGSPTQILMEPGPNLVQFFSYHVIFLGPLYRLLILKHAH